MTDASQPTSPKSLDTLASKKRGRNAARWVRRILGFVLAAALLGGIVVAFLPKPLPVDTGRVRRGDLRVTVDEDGRTRVKDRYVIGAPLAGNLARVELDPGDVVNVGDVVARIVPAASPLLDPRTRAEFEARVEANEAAVRQSDASVARARTALALAEDELGRTTTLTQRGGATQQQLDRARLEQRARTEELASAEFGVRIARHQLEMSRAALGRIGAHVTAETEQLVVRAPVSGRVLRVLQESEGPIAPGAPILEIGDPSALEVVVDVLTSDAVHIERGSKVFIERWGGDRPLEGRVRLVEPSAFTRISALGVEEQRVNVIVDLEGESASYRALGDGYRVETRIVVAERLRVLLVPESSVFRRGDGQAVFTVEGGVAHLRPVRVGPGDGIDAELLSGLADGTEVVVHPSDLLSDGLKVELRQVAQR
ncbi:MAG: HlyD family efflux transporter periplasmic adaptor subunit [Polyangiales bacterium]